MKYEKRRAAGIAWFVCLVIALSGCSAKSEKNTSGTGSSDSSKKQAAVTSVETVNVKYDAEDYSFDWKSQSHQTVDVGGGSQTIRSSGIYEITGTLADGSLIVDVDKNTDDGIVTLVLNGVGIHSDTTAPIDIENAEKVVLILADGTDNTITQGSSVKTDDSGDPSAAIFATSDLTITGGGTLNVTTGYNDGITSKDKLKITDGTIVVNAEKDGIVGKDLLAVQNAAVTITAGKDGMRSTNETDSGEGNLIIKDGTFTIRAGNDGLQAYALLEIDGGTFDITTGGGYTGVTKTSGNGGMGGPNGQSTKTSSSSDASYKGLKATESVRINGGSFTLSCKDDAVHSNGDVVITDGGFTVQSGDDGIHSDADVTISGGSVLIQNSYEGIEGKNVTVGAGSIQVTSSDDGFNVNDSSGVLTFGGGDIYVNAGGDGLDSNGSIVMTDGTVKVDGPTDSGNGALDFDQTFTISGGTVLAAGSSGMAQTPESGTQPSILMYFTSAQSGGTQITLKDGGGNVIADDTPSKTFQSMAISSASLKKGSSYTLYKNGEKVVTFTLSGTATYVNESGVTSKQSNGPGGGGNWGGRGGR